MPGNKFVIVNSLLNYKYAVMIEDFTWWTSNEREILNWMAEHLPRGIEHQQGMTVSFDTEHDRILFLLKWGS